MDQKQFDELLPSIPRDQHRAFISWFVEFQDIITWDKFKEQDYKLAVDARKDIEQHISKTTNNPRQLQLSFMPTSMGRTSPFFVMNKKDMANRQVYQDFPVENPWGKITVSGPKLSIFDESVLLALLSLAKKHKSVDFSTTYSEVCEYMDISRGGAQYKSIQDSLTRLRKTSTETLLTKGKKKEEIKSFGGSILNQVDQDFVKKKIDVSLNPHFLVLYGANLTTSLNMEERTKLKGDATKAMYRFLQTHTPSSHIFHLLTLAHAVNVDIDQPLKTIRKQIRASLGELRKNNHILRWSVDKSDNVHIHRK